MSEKTFDMENYLKDLTPEQQEKARACKTKDELIKLAAEEDIEIPMDALESVAGGCLTIKGTCQKCGSDNIGITKRPGAKVLICKSCGSIQIKKGS